MCVAAVGVGGWKRGAQQHAAFRVAGVVAKREEARPRTGNTGKDGDGTTR